MPRYGISVAREANMRFTELAAKYSEWAAQYKGYSARTVENYGLAFGQFKGYLDKLGLADDVKHFTPDNCQAFAQYLSAGGNKPNSVNTKLAALASLARYGMKVKGKHGYVVTDNPLDRIERPVRQRVTRRFLHRDELRALVELDCPAHERVAIDLFLDTGLRVSELAKANVGDLWEDKAGQVVLSVTVKGQGRRDEKQDVPLGPEVAQRLLALLGQREATPNDPLLVSGTGERWFRTGLSDMIARRARQAGITRMRVGAHCLRHTYNVVARVEAELDEVTRAGVLNQRDAASVRKYDHLLADETREAREKIREGMRRYVG